MTALIRIGNFFFRHRNAVFPFAFLVALAPGKPLFADPLVAVAFGAALASVGQLVRAGTVGFEYIVRGGRNGAGYADGMVTQGIYAHCRNPMYVGNLLILGGMSVVANTLTCLLVALPTFAFIYVAIVAAEEQYLRQKFGADFVAYCQAVPRWLPKLAGIGHTITNMRFHWRRVVLKEYGTPFGWVMGTFLLALWNLWRSGRWEPVVVGRLYLGIICTLVIWATIRVVKKRRLLLAD